jgi:hypothetical protein
MRSPGPEPAPINLGDSELLAALLNIPREREVGGRW